MTNRSGPSPRVLVLTEDCDPTADFVLERLNERGVGFWRVDPGDFPESVDLSAEFDRAWSGQLRGPLRAIDLTEIGAVYYRRPSGFRTPAGLPEPERRFVESQARHAVFGLLAALPNVLWVNRPAAMADARVKPHQLAVAARVGLNTPRTLVTNCPGQVVEFGQRVGRIITKSLAMVTLKDEEERTGLLYTAEVSESDWNSPGIAATAHLFQELIPRDYEVRVTYVAGECFAAAMRPHNPAGALDIRAHGRHVSYEAARVPDDIARAVQAMMERLDLVFGAFDFIVRPDGQWTFIELNPNGQWAWTEQAAGLPISTALADLLEKGAAA
jgi:ATP-grasp ribosomal peptide maturase